MPRIYENDYYRFISPKFTFGNKSEKVGNEYFRRNNYSSLLDRAQEQEKQFTETTVKTEGEGIVDSALNIGKTALNFAKDNKELISVIGSVAGAASQISKAADTARQLDAIKRIQAIRNERLQDNNLSIAPRKIADTPNDNKMIKNANEITTNLNKAKKIINGFTPGQSTGRGVSRKKGGVLKSF